VAVKLRVNDPPRTFNIGRGEPIVISDVAHIELEPNEQVTFEAAGGIEYDVARKAWGFYATPSLNGRLLDHKLRAVLARSPANKYFVFLVERGREDEFQRYLDSEGNVLVRWLDNEADLRACENAAIAPASVGPPLHCMCGGDRFRTEHTYFSPPAGEVRFASAPPDSYRREIYRCTLCGHYISVFALTSDFYQGEYVDATYGDEAGMRRTYDKIMALPPERSDNIGRVARINEFAAQHLPDGARAVLDVGSGLCVFLARMREAGWQGTALDPDERAVRHARDVAGVDGLCGSLPLTTNSRYDVATFNKVLEHVEDPITLLSHSRPLLHDHGFVYVELPDGEVAAREAGFGREEFFVEHFHVFSLASICCLAERAGFEARVVERLREPSGKFTLRAFLTPRKT
jgi:SAM-dependent methyltransferase